MHRLVPLLAWILLVVVAFGPWAPAEARPDQTEWLIRLMTGDWEGENLLVVAEFQLMGIWPVLCALLLRAEWRARPVPAWPFLLASFALGCFVLIPWFATRPAEPLELAPPSRPRGFLAAVLGLVAAALITWGTAFGDPVDFVASVSTNPFLWAMTWDFGAFAALFAVVAIRASDHPLRWLCLVPVLGPATWLAVRELGGRATG